jgi:hypothetical protein
MTPAMVIRVVLLATKLLNKQNESNFRRAFYGLWVLIGKRESIILDFYRLNNLQELSIYKDKG